MAKRPDVLVTVLDGVPQVTVNMPGITVEVRDFDVSELGSSATEKMFVDEFGEKCHRYFVTGGKKYCLRLRND